LIIHQRSHSCERPYKCTECGLAFARNWLLTSHQSVHTGEKPYQCTECSSEDRNERNVKAHELRFHADMIQSEGGTDNGVKKHKLHQSTECHKAYSNKGNLIVHQRSHTGERPYQCTECGPAFARIWLLTNHQSVHTGDKPYQCTECDKAFAKKSNLTVHQRTHTGEKPFQCAECGKAFNFKSNLKTHQLRAHSDKIAQSHRETVANECQKPKKKLPNQDAKNQDVKKKLPSQDALAAFKHAQSVKRFPCPDCGKLFRQKGNLIAHQ